MKLRLTPVLVVVNAGLVTTLLAMWFGPSAREATRWSPPPPATPDFGMVRTDDLRGGDRDIARYMAILDRPVFSMSRRPAPVANSKEAVPARPDPLDAIRMVGVFGNAQGGGMIAQVEGRMRRLKPSDTVGDWIFKEIQGQQAVFVRAGETRTVALTPARSLSVARAATPAGVAVPAARTAPPPAAVPGDAPPPSAARPPPAANAPSPFVTGATRK